MFSLLLQENNMMLTALRALGPQQSTQVVTRKGNLSTPSKKFHFLHRRLQRSHFPKFPVSFNFCPAVSALESVYSLSSLSQPTCHWRGLLHFICVYFPRFRPIGRDKNDLALRKHSSVCRVRRTSRNNAVLIFLSKQVAGEACN